MYNLTLHSMYLFWKKKLNQIHNQNTGTNKYNLKMSKCVNLNMELVKNNKIFVLHVNLH